MKTAQAYYVPIGVAIALAALAYLLWLCGHGFDFTDEGFYLNWIAHPDHFSSSASQFGFIYHPLYRLVGGDIVWLRQANILLTLGAAYLACRSMVGGRGVAFILAASALMLVENWLPTPSYNSLSLQGLLLAVAGLMRPSRSGWVLLAVGGVLLFLSKPTSAALLAGMVLMYAIYAKAWPWRAWYMAAATAAVLLIISALLIDGSMTVFAQRMQSSVHAAALLYGNDIKPMLRLDPVALPRALWGVYAGVMLLTWAGLHRAKSNRMLVIIAAAALVFLVAGMAPTPPVPFQGMMLTAPIITALLMVRWRSIPRQTRALGLLLLALPYAYAFGTDNNYWEVAARSGIFWALGCTVLLLPHRPQAGLTLGLAGLVLTLFLLGFATQFPYRQSAALAQQQTSVTIQTSDMHVPEDTGQHIRAVQSAAADMGWHSGTPLLDLSGQSPGMAYVLNAKPIPSAWSLGGYTGSDAAFAWQLSTRECGELSESWVLLQPDSPRQLSIKTLEASGLYLTAYASSSAAGWVLYKPRNPRLLKQACERSRQ